MANYAFLTTTAVIESQATKYWVASDLVLPFDVTANDLSGALVAYIDHIRENHGVDVTLTAVRNKKKMFRTINGKDVTVGYVITGHTELYDDDASKWKSITIELWVEIRQYRYPFTSLDRR